MKSHRRRPAALLFALALWSGTCCVATAQQPGERASADPPGMVEAGGTASGLGLLRRQRVRAELELVEDQRRQLEALQGRVGERIRRLLPELEGLDREARAARLRAAFAESRRELERQVEQILLPHQMRRLRQLALQQRLQRLDVTAWVTEEMARQLQLDEAQYDRLKERAADLDARLRRQIGELRQQAAAELLQVLTPQQRAAWRELIGASFHFEEPGEEPGEEPVEEPVEEPGEEPGEESVEESVEERGRERSARDAAEELHDERQAAGEAPGV